MNERYDVVIAGAGLVGSILANKFGQAGLRVLLLEAGDKLYFNEETGADERQPLLDAYYETTVRVPNSPYPLLPYAPTAIENNPGRYYYGSAYQKDAPAPSPAAPRGGKWSTFGSTYARIAGGTTWHWLGTCLRYLPSTFRESTLYGHAIDWPIGYDDLEDWYFRAEHEIGVSGDANHQLGAPRRGKPYPMPAILPSYTDRVMAERLQGLTFEGMPVLVEPTPQARNSIPFQDRPPCAGSTNCVTICPIQAKYDATVHLKRALRPSLDPNGQKGAKSVELRLSAVVSKVAIGGDGKVEKIHYRRPDGSGGYHEETATARIYVLATHAVETPKILLFSATDQQGLQNGVANSSGLVGRYLMDHHVRIAWGMADVPLYPFRGPLSTAGVESLRDGDFRKRRAAFRIEIEAIGANWALNSPYGALNEKLAANIIGKDLFEEVGWDVEPPGAARRAARAFAELRQPRDPRPGRER